MNSEHRKLLTETNKLKIAYTRMYSVLSDYIWDFDIVAALVEVEVETYRLFPDLELLRNNIRTLRMLVRQVVDRKDDNRILSAIDTFSKAVNDVEEVYVKIDYPKEVLV